jgi:hypothetical protein
MAVGRENGQIEIYASRAFNAVSSKNYSTTNSINKTDTWTMIHMIPGTKHNSILNVLWYSPSYSSPTANPFTYKTSKPPLTL